MRNTSLVVDATTAPTRRRVGGRAAAVEAGTGSRRVLAAGAAAAACGRQLPDAGRSLSRRSGRLSQRRGGAVAKAAVGCGCFVAEAGHVACRGADSDAAEAAGC
jgi:hypothetical protein